MKESKTTTDDLARMVKDGFDSVEKRLDKVEEGQEEILLKLDNKADRFEVKDLEKRTGKIESKLGIA